MLAALSRSSIRAVAAPSLVRVGGALACRAYSAAVKPDTKLLSQLRKETELSLSQCREALMATNNDYAAALAWLDEKMQAIGAKKASKLEGRVAAEGLVGILVNGTRAAMVEVNCETDFVAKNEHFQDLTRQCAQAVLSMAPADATGESHVDAAQLLAASTGERTISDQLLATVGKLGENMLVRRGVLLGVKCGLIGSYLHSPIAHKDLGKMGALVALETAADTNTLEGLGRQLATHVVGMRPESVPELLSQPFVFDGSLTVDQVLRNAEKSAGSPVKLSAFVRYECGEGIEKRNENFAEEVAKQMA